MLNAGYYLGSYVQYTSERAYKSYLMYIILPNSSLSTAVYFIFSSEGARKASITKSVDLEGDRVVGWTPTLLCLPLLNP